MVYLIILDMKKIILFSICLAVGFTVRSQSVDLGPRSIIKTNLVGLGLFTINANYEYKLNDKFSVGLVGGYKIPSTYTLDANASSTSNNGDLAYTGEITPKGYFLNPYARMYTKGAMTGFYLELYTRYFNYNFQVPYDYEKNSGTVNANADGTASAFGGGLALGTQIPLGKIFVIDLYAGLGMGVGKAHLETNDENLDAQDFADIKAEMDQIEDVEIVVIGKAINNMTYDANSTSAWADIKGLPVPMMRAGVSFGVMF